MKLNNKFTGWYFGVMLVVLLIGGAIVYHEIQWKIDSVEVARHRRLNDLIAEQIRTGGDYTNHPTRKRATVTPIAADSMPSGPSSYYTRGTGWNPEYQANEYRLVVTSFYQINGKYYRISTYSFIPSFGQLLPGVVASFKWILLLLLVLVGISGKLISRYILAPFKRTLKVIQSFDLTKKQRIQLPGTRTDEFRELNLFLEKMTDKAREDYQSLKEFTENASHELQTPTAILRGKLELLMESDIRDDQAILIAEMHNALEKLSRIHSSLTLLTKLDNYKFETKEPVCFSRSARESLASFEELIQMKALTLHARIGEDIFLPLHESLADLLLTNLISNAIRHNQAGGTIDVLLTPAGLIVSNTGPAPEGPTAELFERFRKGNPASDSIGIGLAIVRQICDLNRFTIVYEYIAGHPGHHVLAISFLPAIPASKLLQNVERSLYSEA